MSWNNIPLEWVPVLFDTDITACGVYGFMILESSVAVNIMWGSGKTTLFASGELKAGQPYPGYVQKILSSSTTATQGKVLLAVGARVDDSKRV